MKSVLLILHCWLLLAALAQDIDLDSQDSVGTVNYKGSSLKVFEVDGVHFAEPRISFMSNCNPLRFNYLYRKYQLTLPIKIEQNSIDPRDAGKNLWIVGSVTLTELKVVLDSALDSTDAQVKIVTHLTTPGKAQLIFLCDTYTGCQQLMDAIGSTPGSTELTGAISLFPIGRIGNRSVKFGAARSPNPPSFNCEPGQWVVFQRRLNRNQSFAQNWDAYVKGFGSPDSNYWMGLDQLFSMTVTSAENPYKITSRCELKIETEDWDGKAYWGEYKMFQVLGPDQNYRLRVGLEVSGSHFENFVKLHNAMQFSTYDMDHDNDNVNSCSQLYGFGGWWYNACHAVNLNGQYLADKSIRDHPVYISSWMSGIFVTMKTSLMKFRCN